MSLDEEFGEASGPATATTAQLSLPDVFTGRGTFSQEAKMVPKRLSRTNLQTCPPQRERASARSRARATAARGPRDPRRRSRWTSSVLSSRSTRWSWKSTSAPRAKPKSGADTMHTCVPVFFVLFFVSLRVVVFCRVVRFVCLLQHGAIVCLLRSQLVRRCRVTGHEMARKLEVLEVPSCRALPRPAAVL